MAAFKPLKVTTTGEIQAAQTGDFVDIPNGGTGAITAGGARTALGLGIGTNVQAWGAGLDAVQAALTPATNGFLVHNGANGVNQRTLTGSTRITISNGDGSAANPVWDLSTYADGGGGSFLKFTRDAQGLISGTSAVASGDLTALLNAIYAPLANATFTGSGSGVTLAGDPTAALQAATKQYVDGLAQGLKIKTTATVATTAALPACTYANGASGVGATLTATANGILTVDGYATVLNDYVVVKDQASGFQNGLFKVTTAGTAGVPFVLTRSTDMDVAAEFAGAFIPVGNLGTLNKNSLWLANPVGAVTVGTTAIPFTQLNGATDLIAGNGITITGNTLAANLAARLAFNGSTIDLATLTITGWANGTTFYSKAKVDTYGRITEVGTLVPSDIGAQPVDAALTGIAALTGPGLLAFSATDTPVMRQLATASSARITVTNPQGVAGDPTVDLATIGTPGTYNSVTTDAWGRVISGSTSSASSLSDNFTNGEAGAIAIGRAVYSSAADAVKLANANALGTKDVVGLVGAVSISSGAAGAIVSEGILAATTAQWDAVTGQTGGLTFGARYFLSNATAGALTTTAPTSGYIAPVGIGQSTTKMRVLIGTTILN